jgi:hypothetical protein
MGQQVATACRCKPLPPEPREAVGHAPMCGHMMPDIVEGTASTLATTTEDSPSSSLGVPTAAPRLLRKHAGQRTGLGPTWLVMSMGIPLQLAFKQTSGALGRLVHYLGPGWEAGPQGAGQLARQPLKIPYAAVRYARKSSVRRLNTLVAGADTAFDGGGDQLIQPKFATHKI